MESSIFDYLPSEFSALFLMGGFFAIFFAVVIAIFLAVVLALPVTIYRWWILRKARKLGIRGYRTRSFFWRLVPSFMVRSRAQKMDEASLLGAFHSPENRQNAKEIVRAELLARGVSGQTIDGWHAQPRQLTVPPTIKEAVSAKKYAGLVRLRRKMFAVLRPLAVVSLPLFLIVGLVTSEKEEKQAAVESRIEQQAQAKQRAAQKAIIADKQNVPSETSPPMQIEKDVLPDAAIPQLEAQPDIAKEAAQTPPLSSKEQVASEDFYVIDALPMAAQKVLKSETFELVASMFVLALFSLVFIGPYICRNRAVRILLLRPFGAAKLTSALKKVVLREVGPVGLVYTLEDRNYKPNMFVTFFTLLNSSFLYMIGPLFRPSVRIASVKSSYTYLKLAGRLSRIYRPSIQNFAIGGQAVNVRCSNPWWRRVIDLLMHSSDFILMDLSIVHEGSSWEID